jgi:hypothetical protein
MGRRIERGFGEGWNRGDWETSMDGSIVSRIEWNGME